MILRPRSRTSLCRRYLNNRLSNQRQGHRSRRRQHLLQRRRPRPPRLWAPQPSRGRLTTTLLPRPRIMHHHQNGRLVVSGEERAVDNSWLIIFSPFFCPVVCFLLFLIVSVARAVRIPPSKSPCSLVVDLAKSMPPEFYLFLLSFYCRLYSSSGLIPVSPSLPSLTSSLVLRLVDITYSQLSRVGHLRVTSALLFSFYLSQLYCIITGLHPTIYI